MWLYKPMDASLKRSHDRDVLDELFPPELEEPKAEAAKAEDPPKE